MPLQLENFESPSIFELLSFFADVSVAAEARVKNHNSKEHSIIFKQFDFMTVALADYDLSAVHFYLITFGVGLCFKVNKGGNQIFCRSPLTQGAKTMGT